MDFAPGSPRRTGFAIEHGLDVRHPNRIEVSVSMVGRRPASVRVAGRVVPVMRGSLMLPDP